MKRSTDVVVIGAGTAGLNAVEEIGKTGRDWLLVESGAYGTTCARVGCMPSKLLIAAANRAHCVRHAGEFGIEVGRFRVDAGAVFERLRRERDRFVHGVVSETRSLPAERRICGRARFTGPGMIAAGDDLLIEARAVVVATGAVPFVPPPFDRIRDAVLTSDQVFEMTDLPATLAVVGTGPVGLEIGQALHRLGVQVSFFSDKRAVGPLSDPHLQRRVRSHFRASHEVHLEADIRAADADHGGVTIRWADAEQVEHEARYAAVLVAAGRRPDLAGLHLASAGLVLDDRGLPDWDPGTTRCGESAIFLAGDANDHLPVLHEAADEGRIAGRNAALFPEVETHRRRTPVSIVFSHPQMAIAGAAFESLDQAAIEVGEVSFADQGRARVDAANRGLARIYAEREGCVVVGAELFGPDVEHLAHLLAWSVQQRCTVQALLDMPFYHPVLEEGLRTALRELARKLGVDGECRCENFATSPGG